MIASVLMSDGQQVAYGFVVPVHLLANIPGQ